MVVVVLVKVCVDGQIVVKGPLESTSEGQL